MRAASFLLILSFFFQSHAEGFTVFEKDGLFGIKDHEGQVTVPAVYDRLGWSDDTQMIADGLIGFKENNVWGLLSVKNKVLAEAKFYSLEPFTKNLIKGAIKGKFSNQLFYGLLNESGRTVVGFNYFTLDLLGDFLLVSQYEKTQRFGLLSYSNELLVPTQYQSLKFDNDLFFAFRFDGEFDLYNSSGKAMANGLDSLRKVSEGYVGYQDGYAGFIRENGGLAFNFEHKDIDATGGVVTPVPFANWDIYLDDQLLFQTAADSIDYLDSGLWRTYINGAHHLLSHDSTLRLNDFFLMDVADQNYILKDRRTGKWQVTSNRNEVILTEYDSIWAVKYGFWAQREGHWSLSNRYGDRKNRFQYEGLSEGLNGQFLVKLKGYWGILDALGNQVTPFKYDAISKEGEAVYQVDYLGRQGLMDVTGTWKVKAEYADANAFGPLQVGRKGFGYSYFRDSEFLLKTTMKPVDILGVAVLVKEDSLWGLIDFGGKILAAAKYEKIRWRNGFYELLENGHFTTIDTQGKVIFDSSLEIQELAGHSEDFYLAKMNDRWGFLDFNGRLRISNRYDSAGLYSEGFAPVWINRRWGFIDKDETLTIQPYYDEVGAFKNGLSIVRVGQNFGLLDTSGSELVAIEWKNISLLPGGNYLFQDGDGRVGLISRTGKILFRPQFDTLTDLGGKVLVSVNKKKGILAYSGEQLLKLNYKEIKISGDYTILKY